VVSGGGENDECGFYYIIIKPAAAAIPAASLSCGRAEVSAAAVVSACVATGAAVAGGSVSGTAVLEVSAGGEGRHSSLAFLRGPKSRF